MKVKIEMTIDVDVDKAFRTEFAKEFYENPALGVPWSAQLRRMIQEELIGVAHDHLYDVMGLGDALLGIPKGVA